MRPDRRQGQPHGPRDDEFVVVVETQNQAFSQRNSLDGALFDPLRMHVGLLFNTPMCRIYGTANIGAIPEGPILQLVGAAVVLCIFAATGTAGNFEQTSRWGPFVKGCVPCRIPQRPRYWRSAFS
jgi:hypothetical protein